MEENMSEQDKEGVLKDEKKEAVQAEMAQSEVQETVTPPRPSKEDEKRLGIHDLAQDTMSIAEAKRVEAVTPTDRPVRPSFFIKKDSRHVVEVDILSRKSDGHILSVSKAGYGINFQKDFPYLAHTVLRFTFSIPNYEDMTTYRQRCASFNREAQQMVVNRTQLRNFLLVWHLKDWDMTDDQGVKIELKHDDNGTLNEASIAVVYSILSPVLDTVMTIFERDVLLMN
jgi:hypothetical protein